MKFGPVPTRSALGAILAHSVALPDGRLRKGSALLQEDIDRLLRHGAESVTVARLEPGDLGEDDAAMRLARALVPDPDRAGLRIGAATTGRVNLHADAPGVVEVLADRIHALNALHPSITVATVAPWQRLEAGGLAATVKIIAYAVPEAALEAACLAGQGGLRLRRVTVSDATLIQTRVDQRDSGDKGHRVTAARLARLGVSLAPPVLVDHAIAPLADAIRAASTQAVLILTGSATSDVHDVAPQAVREAGGRVAHYGMPVDPGNLLFYGDLDGRPVIGLPGCARSPALNGADWVIERLFCGVALSPGDIAMMGVGGLLKEIPQRGRPREA
ncbi:molybdopterin-binding protein [Cognatishimia sp. F0-27]|uniref:molybdopterin-binding protein n=1 Tax=Cognatishimia sp. F0-27 TaxID=2816855 RepID=UPI001D0CBCC9|nr:molybdopterin-binding protein [Cognatishimia sp. F0-27]